MAASPTNAILPLNPARAFSDKAHPREGGDVCDYSPEKCVETKTYGMFGELEFIKLVLAVRCARLSSFPADDGFLARNAPVITAQITVFSQDAVAWHDEGNGVAAHG